MRTGRWSAAAMMAALAVAFGTGWFFLMPLTVPDLTIAGRLVSAVATGVPFGIIMGLWVLRQRRDAGDAAREPSFRRSMRTGEIPPGADVASWRQAIEHQRATYLQQRWTGPLVFGFATLMSLWLAVTQAGFWWFGVAFFVALLVVTLVVTPHVLRRTAEMLAHLDNAQR